MTILKSPVSYSTIQKNNSPSADFAVLKGDSGDWEVKNTDSGNILARGESVNNALQNAKDLGIDSSNINSQSAFDLENAPPSFADVENFTDAQLQNDFDNATNQSESDLETISKYQNAGFVSLVNDDDLDTETGINRSGFPSERSIRVPFGAEKTPIPPPKTIVVDRKGNKLERDLRIRIKVPPKYLTGYAEMLKVNEGIIFPFTPSISYEVKADYAASSPMHSNFQVNFYQRSSVGSIQINGKFSVQNEKDAKMYIAMMYLLKAITRMRSGGSKSGDADSGAPPPVCRLFGYGTGMFDNVPVAISNYRIELPDNVDYFTVNTGSVMGEFGTSDVTSVPTLSTIAITCLPMYSREEMQKFSVGSYLAGGLKGKGYL